MGDYTKPPRKRRGWIAITKSLEHLGKPDTADGRRRFLAMTESFVDWESPGKAGVTDGEGLSLQSTLKRGWYFETEEFREKLPKGDWRKGMLAALIRKRALVDNGWPATRLSMGARNAVSRSIKQSKEFVKSDRIAKRVAKELEKMSKSFD